MIRFILLCSLSGILLLITGCGSTSSDSTDSVIVDLSNTFESNGFRFAYPADWRYNIPQTNILFLASPEVLQQQTGASMTVQRSIRLTGETSTLLEAMTVFLERGPLRDDRSWNVLQDPHEVELAQRDGLRVILEGSEVVDSVQMHSEIYVVQADNQLVYVFALSAPVPDWEAVAPIFEAILDSVEILE
ncbi:MAG: hypothetical protein AAF653_12975 [Chloroflexota bacterium]